MATPKPGEIRCPTCHRSTPPAAYCTQCGSAIPSDARARPRGMDRDELQDRIRARRSGGEPYRRGALTDDPGYERFQPEPDDVRARREAPQHERRTDHFDDTAVPPPLPPVHQAPLASPIDRSDLTRDTDDWTAPVPPPVVEDATPTADAPALDDDRVAAASPTGHLADAQTYDAPQYDAQTHDAQAADAETYEAYDDEGAGYPYEYDAWEERPESRSGSGAFAIIGFLALGVLALLGGAVLAGVFNGDRDPVAQGSPTPVAAESVAASPSQAPSLAPSLTASVAPSAEPPASGEPVVFPDGFVAQAQPCIPGSVRADGCNSSGSVNGGQVDIWVGFQNGTSDDVIGATIIGPDGDTVSEGTIPLANIGCGSSCNGHTWFGFGNLEPGRYEVRVTRNGDPASSTSFEVT